MKILILFASLISFSVSAFAAECSRDMAVQENKELESSPYWKAKVDEMMKLLNEERERGCKAGKNEKKSGMAIVSDDIEFVGSDKNRMFSQSLNYTECGKSERNGLVIFPNSESFLAGKSNVRIHTPKGSLRFLANTCSPKEAIANFIPAAKLALQARCGEHRMDAKEADIKIQTEAYGILKGEKAAPQSTGAN